MPDDPLEVVPSPDADGSPRLSPLPAEAATVGAEGAPTLTAAGTQSAETGVTGELAASGFAAGKAEVVIGRYRLRKELGKGGFGMVWQAEQTEPIRREVALKIIKPGMDSREIIARFEAERQALALMDHPNIAAVLDAGTTDRGLPYFVMELVKGVPITEYCDAHKLGLRERLELFIPVCQAVQHAHQKAILHRDLKPSNILVTEVDGKPVPKVIDFGIAKALGATQDEVLQASLAHTREGMIVGTPQYMSPEQAGSVADVDTRSDLYTLGVILYELLVGETPLSREQVKRAALDEVLRVIREAEPRRPSSRFTPATELARTTATLRHSEPKKLGQALRGDLDWIVLKALEKDRTRRYDTANAFAQDLRRHLDDEPVSAGPPSAGYRLRKLVRRNRLAVGAGAGIAVLLAAGITASTWQAVRATRAEKLAEGRRIQAEAAATQARETLSESDFLQALRLINEDKPDDALAQLARSLSSNPRNNAALFRLTALLTYRSFALPVSRLNLAVSRLKYDDSVESAHFSPDGKWIVTAASIGAIGGTARVWDAGSGQPVTKPLEPGGPVHSAQFSPDGTRIVTASGGYTPESGNSSAQVWDARSGRLLAGPMKHERPVWSAEFSPDGKRIVTASYDRTARVWDAQSGQALTEPMKADGEVRSAQFSPDGKRIVTVSNVTAGAWLGKDTARIWDAMSGEPLTAPMNQDHLRLVQFSPDGKRIVIVSDIDTVRVWDAQTGQPLTGPMKHSAEVWTAQFSADGKRIVTTARDRTTRVWDAQSGQPLTNSVKNAGWAESAEFSPNGKWIVTGVGTGDSTAWVWDARPGEALVWLDEEEVAPQFSKVDPAQFSADRKRVLVVAEDHTARVWDAHSGQPLSAPMKDEVKIRAAQFSADEKRIVTVSDDETARVWDTQSGQPVTGPLKQEYGVDSANFSPDGRRIVTTSRDRSVRVWDVQSSRQLIAPVKLDGADVQWAQFSPDGKGILIVFNMFAIVVDAQTGQTRTASMQHEGKIRCSEFSPDGKWIVTGGSDNTARVWDARSGKLLAEPMKHSGHVWTVKFSTDGNRVVTDSDPGVGERGGTRVWDVQSGQPLTEPMESDDLVELKQFDLDRKSAVASSPGRIAPAEAIPPGGGRLPEWLPRLAEAVAGQRLNDRGVLEPLEADQGRVLEAIRAQLSRAPADDDWAIWGRWFLADRSTRTIAPFSESTVPEYIEGWISENTPASLDEAERLAVGNAELLRRIAQAREVLSQQATSPAGKEKRPAAKVSGTLKMQGDRLALQRQEHGPEHPETLVAMASLAKAYADAGRWDEAFPLWTEASRHLPKNTSLALTIATLQVWFGKDSDYAATCQRLIELAAGTSEASTAERVAKACCLRPSSDPRLLESALTLARRSVELGYRQSNLAWYQMSLGMAEYRHGNFPEADQALSAAEDAGKADHLVTGTAQIYHAMSLFRQGKEVEARQFFAEAEAHMDPLPADANLPLANGADADSVIVWLADKEAKALLESKR